jgi:hypothetical protein
MQPAWSPAWRATWLLPSCLKSSGRFRWPRCIATPSNGARNPAVLAYIPNCLASWFTVTSNVAGGLPAVIQPGGHVTDTITTSLTNQNVDQSSCENTQPQINLVTG